MKAENIIKGSYKGNDYYENKGEGLYGTEFSDYYKWKSVLRRFFHNIKS